MSNNSNNPANLEATIQIDPAKHPNLHRLVDGLSIELDGSKKPVVFEERSTNKNRRGFELTETEFAELRDLVQDPNNQKLLQNLVASNPELKRDIESIDGKTGLTAEDYVGLAAGLLSVGNLRLTVRSKGNFTLDTTFANKVDFAGMDPKTINTAVQLGKQIYGDSKGFSETGTDASLLEVAESAFKSQSGLRQYGKKPQGPSL